MFLIPTFKRIVKLGIAVGGFMLLSHTSFDTLGAELSTILQRGAGAPVVCTTQGNGTSACTGCLRNSCRSNSTSVALQECNMSCADTAVHGSAGDRCLNQGNRTTACLGCLRNECRGGSPSTALAACDRSCKTSSVSSMASTSSTPTATSSTPVSCQTQGRDTERCRTCLERRCQDYGSTRALFLCSFYCGMGFSGL